MTDWKLVEGSKPEEIDTTSSAYTVYLRRNIQAKKDEETGEETGLYTYEEKQMTHDEYKVYLAELKSDEIDIEHCSLDELKTYKINEVNQETQQAIYKGVTVELSDGKTHTFSLTADDQTNINSLYASLMIGLVDSVPYHANGEDCTIFSKEDFTKVAMAAQQYKTYNVHSFLIEHLQLFAHLHQALKGIQHPPFQNAPFYLCMFSYPNIRLLQLHSKDSPR